MTSKLTLSIFCLSFLMFSCNSQTKQTEKTSENISNTASSGIISKDGKEYTPYKTPAPTNKNQPIEQLDINLYDIKDTNTGVTMSTAPLPGKWQQVNSKDFQFIGRNGIKILGARAGSFSYSDDPQKQELFRSLGMPIRYPKTMEQIIQEDFLPNAAPYNRKLIKTYPLPEATKFYENFDAVLYKIDLETKVFEAIATEWEDPDGTSYLTVIVKHQETGYNADSWGYAYDCVQSPKANFEQAKRILISYMVNQQLNMDWIRTSNNALKSKIDASNMAHQKMMANVKRNMDLFQERQAELRRDREVIDNRISNYILGKSDAVNPQTGTVSKVEAGSTYYWINQKGEYISTEDHYWNPNEHEPYKKYDTWTRSQI